MKNILIAFMVFGSIVFLESCYYDEPPQPLPFDCNEVSFSTHIQPIFEASCSTSGCHDGSRVPDLRADVSWNLLVNGGYVNLSVPEESKLFKSVSYIEEPMPPGGIQISDLNKELVLCWISEGALND
jgi:hypothetical protein